MTRAFPLRVAELPYVNTLPFRLGGLWRPLPCPSPRLLGEWADQGRIDAGVVSLVDAWRLEDRFEPIGPFGIACRGPARSVLLFSRRPWTNLGGAVVGVTDQSSTSARLLRMLLEDRDRISARLHAGFAEGDDARLLIGDGALTPPAAFSASFPIVVDLGEEWHRWKALPFVFARWMVRRSISRFWREALEEALLSAFQGFRNDPERTCRQAAQGLRLPVDRVAAYFSGLTFRLGDLEEKGAAHFRELAAERPLRA